MNRPFRLDVGKTIQAVAFLLRREPHRCMNYMRLLKVLYLAEREILTETSRPLTGSPVVAMKRGPVLEEVYSLIRHQHTQTPEWAKYFTVHDYHLELRADPGVGRLSKFVLNKLEEVAKRFEGLDEWDLVEFTHKLPEWRENNPGDSSKPIALEDILRAVGREQDLQQILERAAEDQKSADTFAA